MHGCWALCPEMTSSQHRLPQRVLLRLHCSKAEAAASNIQLAAASSVFVKISWTWHANTRPGTQPPQTRKMQPHVLDTLVKCVDHACRSELVRVGPMQAPAVSAAHRAQTGTTRNQAAALRMAHPRPVQGNTVRAVLYASWLTVAKHGRGWPVASRAATKQRAASSEWPLPRSARWYCFAASTLSCRGQGARLVTADGPSAGLCCRAHERLADIADASSGTLAHACAFRLLAVRARGCTG